MGPSHLEIAVPWWADAPKVSLLTIVIVVVIAAIVIAIAVVQMAHGIKTLLKTPLKHKQPTPL